MPHYRIKTLDTSKVVASLSDNYYIKGLSNASNVGAYVMDDGTTKKISAMVVADPSMNPGAMDVNRKLYAIDNLSGLFVKSVALVHHSLFASPDPYRNPFTYTLDGECSVEGTTIHLVDASVWNPSMELSNMSEGYFGSVVVDSSKRFTFSNVQAKVIYSALGGMYYRIPPFPDGVTDIYPYYICIRFTDGLDGKCLMAFSDQPMYIVEDEYLFNNNSSYYSKEGLHLPGNYITYTYDYTDPTIAPTKYSEGSNGAINVGSISIGCSSIFANNFDVTAKKTSGEVSSIYPASGLMGVVYLVAEGKAKYSDLSNIVLSDIRLTITDNLEDHDIIYATVPAIIADDGTTGQNDYPTITITGTCPNDVEQIFVSYVDPNNISYATVIANPLGWTTPSSDGTFTITCDAAYHKDINGGSIIKYQTDFDNLAVWCKASSGTITAEISNIKHNQCLSGDTLITMADGSQKRLDSLTTDDEVMAGTGLPTKIVKLTRGVWSQNHILYHFSDGTIIDETYEHRFFNVTQGYWQKLKLWKIGDRAKCTDRSTPILVKVEKVNEMVEQFGIWTESHDYFANNLLSGDVKANLKLLSDATIEQFVGMISSIPAKKLIAGFKGE